MNSELLQTVNCIILELEQLKVDIKELEVQRKKDIKELENRIKELVKNDNEQRQGVLRKETKNS